MERIILVGHGSPKKEANTMEHVGGLLHARIHQGCKDNCVMTCYLQYDTPTLTDAIEDAVGQGATNVIIHPYFLNSGVHVTEDIPRLIDEAREKHNGIEFLYTDPLGLSEGIVKVVVERINAAKGIAPGEIEAESFRTITGETDLSEFPEEVRPIITRVIHTTADFSFKDTLAFHADAVKAGVAAVKAGKKIVTDVEMLKAGINKKLLGKWGGEVICGLNGAKPSEDETRTEAAIEQAMTMGDVGIVAIGNAPTALVRCVEVINAGKAKPDLVVGVPVGFIRAEESKDLLIRQNFPYISNVGRKGGSTVAAAIVNAILKIADAA